jgi:proteasome component ECM29
MLIDRMPSRVWENLVELKMDREDDNKASGKSEEAATITAGVSALFRAVNVKFLDPSPLTHLPKLLGTIKTILPSVKVTVATKLTLYERTKVLFDGLQQRTHSQGSSNYDLVLGYFMLLEVPGGSGSEIMRTKRAETAEMVAKTLVGGVFGMHRDGRNACSEKMIAMVVEGRANERSPGVKTALDRVSEALKE